MVAWSACLAIRPDGLNSRVTMCEETSSSTRKLCASPWDNFVDNPGADVRKPRRCWVAN